MAEKTKLSTQSPAQNASWGDLNPHAIVLSPNYPTVADSSQSNSRPVTAATSPRSEADLRTSRRRAQNRIAQRTYRARKENAIKEHEQRSAKLEKEVSDLRTHNAKLEYGIHCLKNQVMELQKSNLIVFITGELVEKAGKRQSL
ncbi:hypothetical protein DV736_g3396, partial [Chaetothyriales sp. CBS 134916]